MGCTSPAAEPFPGRHPPWSSPSRELVGVRTGLHPPGPLALGASATGPRHIPKQRYVGACRCAVPGAPRQVLHGTSQTEPRSCSRGVRWSSHGGGGARHGDKGGEGESDGFVPTQHGTRRSVGNACAVSIAWPEFSFLQWDVRGPSDAFPSFRSVLRDPKILEQQLRAFCKMLFPPEPFPLCDPRCT